VWARAKEELSLLVTAGAAVAIALNLPGCSQSSAPTVDAGLSPDGTVTDASPDAPVPTGDAGPIGSCVVRPACEACVTSDAGVCCVYPNPKPPPGPENAIACDVCPADGGPKFVTLTCNNESDCPKSQVCCISAAPNSGARSFCAAACDPQKRQVGLCDSNAATSACPSTAPCSRNNIDDWNLPHCYGTCGGVSP
jgi:hypothetical protein